MTHACSITSCRHAWKSQPVTFTLLVRRRTFMPRDKGGFGRTGGKAKKTATHNIHRQPKADQPPAASRKRSKPADPAELPWLGPHCLCEKDMLEHGPACCRACNKLPQDDDPHPWRKPAADILPLPPLDNLPVECVCPDVQRNGHGMFCRGVKCFAYEIGCCPGFEMDYDGSEFEPPRTDDDQQLDFVRCRCIIYKDDYPLRHRDAAAWPACPLEPGLRPPRWRNGRYRPYRPYCDKDAHRPCRCDRHFCNFIAEGQVGRYVPMCPWIRGYSGKRRGDVVAEARGHALCATVRWEHRTWFGSHLPRHPEDRSAAQLRQFWLDECGDRLPIADI